jgi:hypothetical protein
MSKSYGCPKCGSVEGFREINLCHVDYNFVHFDYYQELDDWTIANYGDSEVNYEDAQLIPSGCFQCRNCDCFFNEPAEIEGDKPVEGTGEIVDQNDVDWGRSGVTLSARETATMLAALHLLRDIPDMKEMFPDHLQDVEPLNQAEMDALRERISRMK